jgi:hypothetical protein
MPTRRNSPESTKPPTNKPLVSMPSSWKDHPLVVAAGAVAATIALAVLLVKEVILPTHTASLANQISDLQRTKIEKEKLEAKVSDLERQMGYRTAELEKQLSDSKKKISAVEKELAAAQLANLFSSGSPYPAGLTKVRVGDLLSSVKSNFPAEVIDANEVGYLAVATNGNVIESVVYYYDDRVKTPRISHISFTLPFGSKLSEEFLQDKLIESLGQPTTNPRKSYYSWKLPSGLSVFKSDSRSYIVMSTGLSPAYWPAR